MKAVEGRTPYEAWMGRKPTVTHLRVFGCDAYVQMKEENSTQKQRSAFSLAMGRKRKGIDFTSNLR